MATAKSTQSAQSLIPAAVKFTIGTEVIRILDADLALSFQNGCSYQECMTRSGFKSYVLTKGTCVTQTGDVKITIVDTPDGKQDATIKNLQTNLKNAQVKDNPTDYAKTVVATFDNPSSEKFLEVKFEGYVSELNVQAPDSTNFITYEATVVVYDPVSLKISN